MLDEFAAMPPIPNMSKKMNVSAGRNILFHLFVQSLNQLEGGYKKSAGAIQQACGNLIYVYSSDNDTNKYISELLSTFTKTYKTYSSSKSGENSSQHVDAKPLMNPFELRRLKKGEVIIIRQRLNPIFTRFKYFYTFALRKTSTYDIPSERAETARLSSLLPDFPSLISIQQQHISFLCDEKAREERNSSIKKDITLQDVFFYYEHERVAKENRKATAKAAPKVRSSGTAARSDASAQFSPLSVSIAEIDSLSAGVFSEFLSKSDFGSAKKIINRIAMRDPEFKAKHSTRLYEYVEARKNSM